MKTFNTGETEQDLREKYNPDGSDLRKAQERMLDMLLYLDQVCRQLGLSYRLQAGSVLGSVRHNGFIPWDDDVDVVLNRRDWKQLSKYLIKHPHPQYVLQCHTTDSGYYGFWNVLRDLKSEYIQDSIVHNTRKYRGLQIDIFCFENRQIPLFARITGKISRINKTHFIGRKPLLASLVFLFQKNILHPVFRMIGYFCGNKTLYMHTYGSGFLYRMPQEVLLPYKQIPFEKYFFWGPAQPERFCELRYGNYTDLPPINQRNKHKAQYRIWE